MNFHKPLLIILIICFNNSYSQTGPGGVGTNDGTSNLKMWFRPDNGLSTTFGSVANWENSAGLPELNIFEANPPTRPNFVGNAVNGYAAIDFDGNERLKTGFNELTPSNFVTDQTSTFIISKADNTTQRTSIFITVDSDGSASGGRFNSNLPWNTRAVFFDLGSDPCCNSNNRIQTSPLSVPILTNYSIWNFDANLTTGKQLYRNGALLANNPNAITPANTANATYSSHLNHRFILGAQFFRTSTSSFQPGFQGDIAEVVIFKNKINTTQRHIVNNYLAAKYNQALTSNDLYTQDNPANGNYDHKVAGIGRVDASDLHDDSKGTGIVHINTPSNLGDNEYLFWGENVLNSDYAFTTSAATNYRNRINTVWRVSETGDVGTVTISIDASDIHLSTPDVCNNLSLAVSSSATFPSPTTYSLTLSSGVYTATGVDFADGDYFTVEYLDQIVWDGTSFFNGSGAGNAPDVTDQCLKFTVKPGAAGTLTFNAHVREVEVESGGTINVADGILLQVENQVQVDGVIDLLGEAELVQNHTSTTSNSGMGELRVRQQGTSSLYNYNYWSAPVNRASAGGAWQIGFLEDANGVIPFTTAYDADPSTMPITLSNYWLHEFNATTGVYTGWHRLSTTSNLSPGTGYTMKGSGATSPEQEYIFKGIPNDGNYTHTVVTAGNDFLVGNPYPSRLNANQFITDNLSIIDGSLYFWEQFSTNNSHVLRDYQGGYAVYNLMMSSSAAVPDASGLTSGQGMESKGVPTQNIAVGQGFFVTINNSGSIVFNNAQRVVTAGPSVFYKNSKKGKKSVSPIDNRPKIWFSFTDPNEHTKVLGLGYDPDNATYAYDNGYDAKSYENNRNDVSWSLNGEKLIIQALSTINIQDELPLAVKATDAGIYKFSINKTENLPDDLNIFLKDNQQNVFYDLKAGEAQILINENTEHNHFSIVFNNNSVLNTTNNAKTEKFFTAYNSKTKHLKLHNVNNDLSAIKSLNIYNTLGQLIKNFKSLNANNSINLSNLNDGIYILKIGTKNSENITGIKFIKY